jgi:hypothetical protein
VTPPSASNGPAGALLIMPRSAGEDTTPYRTLRETYGSIPAASSADRRALDASIASAMAQLAEADAALVDKPAASAAADEAAGADSAHVTGEHGGARMTSNPLFSGGYAACTHRYLQHVFLSSMQVHTALQPAI